MLLISQGLPTYASSDGGFGNTAAMANSENKEAIWYTANTPSSGNPEWLAYDISSISNKTTIIIVIRNDPSTSSYDYTITGLDAYTLPQNFTIEVNTTSGGVTPPSSGWSTLITEASTTLHSHIYGPFNLSAYNWLRIHITASINTTIITGVSCGIDLFDASSGITDCIKCFGDSITETGIKRNNLAAGGTLAQIMHHMRPSITPLIENAATGHTTSGDAASHISGWLNSFPGNVITLNYGTNDALQSITPSTFQTNMITMITAALTANLTIFIPTIPWGSHTNIIANAPALNAIINGLYNSYPQIIPGPDLWTYFNAHQGYISTDTIHPNSIGYNAYRWLWAGLFIQTLYSPSSAFSNLLFHT